MRSATWSICLLFAGSLLQAQDTQLGLRVPAGFEITEYADSKLANDIFSMTLDPQGRVVVSGRGYIRILVEDDGQGRATRAISFADGPKDGAQGLLWEGRWLYVTGDGGLRRYPVSADGNRAAGPSELIRAVKTGGEHDAHAIRRGPDGWLYLQAWTAWFARTYPALAGKLGNADGVDAAGWNQRLARLDWSAGDGERGKAVFTRASCAACHSGGQALGPDLRGVAGRFSRDDLFTAIIQPSLDISPRYRTTQIATEDGKVYEGLVIYEAVDSLILQTGPAVTVRLVNKQISFRRVTQTSMMPVGLIDRLSDPDIADLYAYLKSLSGSPAQKHL